jgi:hypothetical protein
VTAESYSRSIEWFSGSAETSEDWRQIGGAAIAVGESNPTRVESGNSDALVLVLVLVLEGRHK